MVPFGEPGEICARGPQVMVGYWNRPDETAKAMTADGFFRTGDVGVFLEDWSIKVVDRLKDMIKTGGENVFSAEVENALAKHPAVMMSAVIAIPDPQGGEAVHAVVVLRPGQEATQEDIVAHCKAVIAGYKSPRSVAFVDALPMTGAGKILKTSLREPFWQGLERAVA